MDSLSLAQQKFGDAVFEHYRDYLRKNEPHATKTRLSARVDSRGIADILTQCPPPGPPSPKLLALIQGFRDVEALLADYSAEIARIVRNSASQLHFTMFWTGEEAIHTFALNEYLIACGAQTPRQVLEQQSQLLTNCKWDPVRVDKRFNDIWYGPVCYVTVQEKITSDGYGRTARLAEAEGQLALAKILRRLAGEESRHHAFYLGIAKLAQSYKPEIIANQLEQVVRDFAMPGKYAPGLPEYDAWTATGQELGVVPDPRFAAPLASRIHRGRKVLSVEEYQQHQAKIDCWNSHIKSILGIFRELKLQVPKTLRLIQPIPVPS